MSIRPNISKKPDQAKVQSDIEAYLAAGGTITIVPVETPEQIKAKGLRSPDYNNSKKTTAQKKASKGGRGTAFKREMTKHANRAEANKL